LWLFFDQLQNVDALPPMIKIDSPVPGKCGVGEAFAAVNRDTGLRERADPAELPIHAPMLMESW
jgi:hypothetical protein